MGRKSERGSVSRWIPRLREGDENAARTIWDRYKQQMHAVAGRELGHGSRSVADEEDVMVDAFAAFLRRSSGGAYETMSNRDDLWRLLATITRTCAWKQSRFFGRLRRRSSQPSGETTDMLLRHLASGHPTPETLATVSDTLQKLLEILGDPELKQVALGRLKGLTNEEIAEQLDRSVRTIERRLEMIRNRWSDELDQ